MVGITFQLGQVQLTEYDEHDVLRAQPDGLGASPRLGSHQTHHFSGFASRSNDPDTGPNGEILEGSGGLALVGKDGTDRFVIPLGDPRNLAKVPILKKGEAMMYGPAANFVRMHLEGDVTTFASTDGTLNGKSVYSQVKPDGFLWFSPWGKQTFGATGFHMLHSSGARIDCGAIGGLPAPLNALSSYAKISAAMVQIEGAMVAIGTASGVPDAIAKATPVIEAFTAIGSALTAIQAALVAMAPALTPGAPATAAGTAIGAAGAAVVPAVAACSASTLAVPSSCATVT